MKYKRQIHSKCKKCGVPTNELSMHGLCSKCQRGGKKQRMPLEIEDITTSAKRGKLNNQGRKKVWE